MGTLREALDRLEEAKVLLSEAIRNDLGIEPLRIEKIAVRVNNEREFKFLMEHYGSLGWKSMSKETPDTIMQFNKYHPCLTWAYHDQFFALRLLQEKEEYKIIDFDFFCAQKGLTPPKFIMDSIDGVPLYFGDEITAVRNTDGNWYVHTDKAICNENWENSGGYKFFSNRKAAESWIKEQEPKEKVLVKMPNVGLEVIAKKDGINIGIGFTLVNFTVADVEAWIAEAKKLNAGK